MAGVEPSLEDVLERAAQLQEFVPGAVLVGGSEGRRRRSMLTIGSPSITTM